MTQLSKEPFYCQRDIEMESKCDNQCEHCKEYYKPLETKESKEEMSAEKMLEDCFIKHYYVFNIDEKRMLLNLMQEYAEAYHQSKLSEITEERIQNYLKDSGIAAKGGLIVGFFVKGANWLLNELKNK